MVFSDYVEIVKEKMGERRFMHSVNVSNEAVRLAKKYGADEEKAELAGLLHDITKEFLPDEQLQIISDGGIILTNVEKESQKLWHAISGMVFLRDKLCITDTDILNCVRYHTTGRAGMSLLEKTIFLADFTSVERDFPDVAVIREKAEISLEEGMLYGITYTIKRLADKGVLIHPDAVNAFNELIYNR